MPGFGLLVGGLGMGPMCRMRRTGMNERGLGFGHEMTTAKASCAGKTGQRHVMLACGGHFLSNFYYCHGHTNKQTIILPERQRAVADL